jgi:predicted RNA binding protein YcfA (HicA-like mRNA interferase family)
MKFRASGSHAQYVQAHGAKSTIILMEIGAWL